MNQDKLWKNILILSVITVVGGTAAIFFLLTDTSPDGSITLTSSPWWLWWVIGLIRIGAFMASLVEVRRRNNGEMNFKVFFQTILYVGFFVGVILLFNAIRN